jgi:hypothetical protein
MAVGDQYPAKLEDRRVGCYAVAERGRGAGADELGANDTVPGRTLAVVSGR